VKDSPPPPGQRVSSANPDALSTRCPAPCGRGPQGALACISETKEERKTPSLAPRPEFPGAHLRGWAVLY